MDRAELQAAIDEIRPGDTIQVTFKPGTGKKGVIDGTMRAVLVYFAMMEGKNVSFINQMDYFTILAVIESGYWDHNANRIVKVQIPDEFDKQWFSERLMPGLEGLTITDRKSRHQKTSTGNPESHGASTPTMDELTEGLIGLFVLFQSMSRSLPEVAFLDAEQRTAEAIVGITSDNGTPRTGEALWVHLKQVYPTPQGGIDTTRLAQDMLKYVHPTLDASSLQTGP